MARATARAFAALGHPVQLAARDADSMELEKADLETRYGVAVTLHEFDALDVNGHEAFVDGLPVLPRIAICAVGTMGEQDENEKDPAKAVAVLRSNFRGPRDRFRGAGGTVC